jgi:hypothetical protein
MAAGDVTATYLGRGKVGTAAFLALITGQNVGAQAKSATTKDIIIVSTGVPGEHAAYLLTRAA